MTHFIKVSKTALLAADRMLREYSHDFDDGTPDGSHVYFIKDFLDIVLPLSEIVHSQPADTQEKLSLSFSIMSRDKPL